jgi:hypothetical protein
MLQIVAHQVDGYNAGEKWDNGGGLGAWWGAGGCTKQTKSPIAELKGLNK